MALSLQQVQRQQQRLIMTPQMQQSIQLLQMNSMDLETLIRDEMLENPFLEVSDDEENLNSGAEESVEAEERESLKNDNDDASGLSENSKETASADDSFDFDDRKTPNTNDDVSEKTEGSEDFEKFKENDVDWSEQFDDSDTMSFSSVKEQDVEENDFTTYTSISDSLYDSLRKQLRLSVLSGKNYEIGEFIIGNINEDGYLDCTLENMCLMVGYPPELVMPDKAGGAEEVLKGLRTMLARLHSGENPEAFIGMKRKELIARICADLLGFTYDEVASMKREERLGRMIARQIKKEFEEIMELNEAEVAMEAIAFREKTDADRVFDVLEIIQEFEPTGVCARNLAECLRLQCEEQGIRNRVLYQILDDHLSDLQQKRFREIAKALEVSEDKVTEVFNIISRLDPKPGRSQTRDTPQYITPDVYVKKVDGKYMYFLNEGDAGRLMVASNYRRMMVAKQKGRGRQKAADATNAAEAAMNGTGGTWTEHKSETLQAKFGSSEVDYASEKYKSAVWLIRNIEKRKSTILRVTEAIMEYQKEFLEKGIEHLRPLTLRDIAERVGMHESTIARVTTRKYVETPRGIFELKYFFSSGLETDDGEAASSRSIKELLTQMIEAEEKRRPLSDQKIADMLRAKGFQIARRTVAKYREQLKILPAKLRKDVN